MPSMQVTWSVQPETARIIGDRLGIQEIHLDRSRDGRRQVEGTTEEERLAKWGAEWIHWILDGSLQMQGLFEAVRAEDIVRQHPDGRVIVVSHGAVLAEYTARSGA